MFNTRFEAFDNDPTVDNIDIYKKEAQKVLDLFEEFCNPDNPHDLSVLSFFLATLHTVCLPLSLTAGAGLAAVLSIAGRKPLTKEEMNQLMEDIQDMDAEGMEAIRLEILKRDYYSKNSQDLKDNLIELYEIFTQDLEDLWQQETSKLMRPLIQAEKAKYGALVNQSRILKFRNTIQLTEEESYVIKTNFQKTSAPQYERYHLTLKQLILNYLSDRENVGTRLQHVIYETLFEEAEPLESSFKF